MKLKELRGKTTQKELARILEIPDKNLSNYEVGRTEPDIATLIKIADYYGVSLDYLCEHETKAQLDLPPLNEDQKTAIQMLVKLNFENFKIAYSRIAGLLVTQVN